MWLIDCSHLIALSCRTHARYRHHWAIKERIGFVRKTMGISEYALMGISDYTFDGQGLFTHLKFPCAQFLCTGLAGIINCINYFAVTTLYSITFDRRPTIWSFVGGCVLPWKYGLQGFGCVLWWYWANRRLFSLHESGVDWSHFMSQGQQLYTKSSTHMLSTVKSATSHKDYEKLGVKLVAHWI